MTVLAIDGGTPVRSIAWPAWPPTIDASQLRLAEKVLRGSDWGATSGRLCDEFAERFARFHEADHGVVTANGTVALFVALKALGVEPGDEVIVPAYTFVACATAVILAGAIPVFSDVDPVTLHLSAENVAERRYRIVHGR